MFIIFLYCISSTLSSFINCPEFIQQDCDDYYNPVCVYSQEKNITKQYYNACDACKISTTQQYYEGECEELINNNQISRLTSESNEQSKFKKYCDEKTRYLTDCNNFESIVCGKSICENCTINYYLYEYFNSCVACSNSVVISYYDGYCKNEDTESEIIYCSLNRPSECDENLQEQVCSQTTSLCTDEDCVLESKSWCEACSNSNVFSYYQGSCQEYLEYVKHINIMEAVVQNCKYQQPENCTEVVQEVCATELSNNGSTYQKTYANSCLACKNENVQSYLPFSCSYSYQIIIWSMSILLIQ